MPRSFIAGSLNLGHRCISEQRHSKTLIGLTFFLNSILPGREKHIKVFSQSSPDCRLGKLGPQRLSAFRWLVQDCYSRAGHFHFPTVLEPKLALRTKAEDWKVLSQQEGRSHGFLKAVRRQPEVLAPICSPCPSRAGQDRGWANPASFEG